MTPVDNLRDCGKAGEGILKLDTGVEVDYSTVVSHGLVVNDAKFYDTSTDLRLLDLERNQKMMSSSCRLHMLCAEDGYAFGHNGCISGDASKAR